MSHVDRILEGFRDVDGSDEHCKDVLRKWGEELDHERSLEARHSERDQDDPEADPGPPDEELDLGILGKLVQGLVKHHQRARHTFNKKIRVRIW